MSQSVELQAFVVNAINLPEHAHNPIHTDAGAQAAGFERALVAGVSVYAYLTHPPADAWGVDWLESGGGELRLKAPVFDGEEVRCLIEASDANESVVATTDKGARASFEVWREAHAPEMRSGQRLNDTSLELTEDWARYGVRAGDTLSLYEGVDFAHPALWPNLANTVFTEQLVDGPWIHTRTRIWHQSRAHVGETLRIESAVIDRFETRAGERAVVDMALSADNRAVVRMEHEALVRLNRST